MTGAVLDELEALTPRARAEIMRQTKAAERDAKRARFKAKPWWFRWSIYTLLAGLGAAAGLGGGLVAYGVMQLIG